MNNKKRTFIKTILSICMIVVMGISSVGVAYCQDIVFSGLDCRQLSYGTNDVLNGISARMGGDSLSVRVESITAHRIGGSMLTPENVFYDNIQLSNGRYLSIGHQDYGKIYRIKYGAYSSPSDTSPIATAERVMVASNETDNPWMYAETPRDPTGAIGDPGSTITYHVFLYNNYDDDVFHVEGPVPDGTTLESVDRNYTESNGTFYVDVPIRKRSIESFTFTLRVSEEAAGSSIVCEVSYIPENWDVPPCLTNDGWDIRTDISGTVPTRTYRVMYNASGGDNPPTDSKEYSEGDKAQLLTPENMTADGKVFLGWSQSSEAIHAQYTYNQLSNGTANITITDHDVTLYAVWRDINTLGYVNVSVIWSDMEFTYCSADWNPDTHHMDGKWEPTTPDGNKITVRNEGTSDVSILYNYIKAKDGVEGSFYENADGSAVINSKVLVPIGRTNVAYLLLAGTPDEALDSARLGNVTITITYPGR